MHTGMGLLANFLGVMDAGVRDQLDVETNDPSYLGAADHEAHAHSLQAADQSMTGATFAIGFLDSMPGMIDRFRSGGMHSQT
jgi:hypothetical protein